MTETELLETIEKWAGWTSREDALRLGTVAESILSLNGCFLEIGSFKGKSTAIINYVAKNNNVKMVCIDPFQSNGGTFNDFVNNLKSVNLYDNIIAIASTSENVEKIWNEPIKFLFIDADHDYESVRRQFYFYEKFAVSGAVILFDDTIFTNRMFENYNTYEETNKPIPGDDTGWIGPTKLFNEVRFNMKDRFIPLLPKTGSKINGLIKK